MAVFNTGWCRSGECSRQLSRAQASRLWCSADGLSGSHLPPQALLRLIRWGAAPRPLGVDRCTRERLPTARDSFGSVAGLRGLGLHSMKVGWWKPGGWQREGWAVCTWMTQAGPQGSSLLTFPPSSASHLTLTWLFQTAHSSCLPFVVWDLLANLEAPPARISLDHPFLLGCSDPALLSISGPSGGAPRGLFSAPCCVVACTPW